MRTRRCRRGVLRRDHLGVSALGGSCPEQLPGLQAATPAAIGGPSREFPAREHSRVLPPERERRESLRREWYGEAGRATRPHERNGKVHIHGPRTLKGPMGVRISPWLSWPSGAGLRRPPYRRDTAPHDHETDAGRGCPEHRPPTGNRPPPQPRRRRRCSTARGRGAGMGRPLDLGRHVAVRQRDGDARSIWAAKAPASQGDAAVRRLPVAMTAKPARSPRSCRAVSPGPDQGQADQQTDRGTGQQDADRDRPAPERRCGKEGKDEVVRGGEEHHDPEAGGDGQQRWRRTTMASPSRTSPRNLRAGPGPAPGCGPGPTRGSGRPDSGSGRPSTRGPRAGK